MIAQGTSDNRKQKTLTEQVGDRIRQARERKRLSQTALAGKVKMTQASISQIERGHRKQLKTTVLMRIAVELDTPIDYLISGDESKDQLIKTSANLRHIMQYIVPNLPENEQEEVGSALRWLIEWRYGIASD
jgi:transcriptional regulator with XRE-family HTH domain